MTDTIEVKFATRMTNGVVKVSKVKLEFDELIHPSDVPPFVIEYAKGIYPLAKVTLCEVPRL